MYIYVYIHVIHVYDMINSNVCNDPFICLLQLIHICAMTHSPWPIRHIHTCLQIFATFHAWQPWITVTAHTWMSHNTDMSESWRIYERVMAHIRVSHGTCINESWHTYEWVMAHIRVSHGTYINESWHNCFQLLRIRRFIQTMQCTMGWLRLVGSLKL